VQTAAKGSEGDSQSFGKGVDHGRRSGGPVNFTTTYTLTPKQVITSP